MLMDIGLMFYHQNPFKVLQYFTMWGIWMTFITLSTGLYIQFKYPTEYSISSQYEASKRHNPFQAWKFHIFVYELALVSEIIITIFFWTLLWPYAKDATAY
mmetsp:Transcript_18400/g.31464  ORF Transcript_18400/g.31464 Transcript_18400/m.31464 type:complete len:101 (+) Transcript_18400:315-617(+)